MWAPWPRAPQCSEFGALAWAGLYAEGPIIMFPDCRNAASLMSSREADASAGKRQSAGFGSARRHVSRHLTSFANVAARRDIDEGCEFARAFLAS
eukprot:4503811-Pyramimonas_sp.AAC.1